MQDEIVEELLTDNLQVASYMPQHSFSSVKMTVYFIYT